jgi:predicted RNase H-like nuclease
VAAVGVDACRRGWVAVALRDPNSAAVHFLPRIDRIAEVVPDAAAIAIDIPIGLPATSPRQADLAARRLLGPRRNSVFVTPIRAALTEPTHVRATASALSMTGAGISRQAFALRSRIFEVEEWLPDARCGVWEVHPEVSFAQLIGRPARAAKKTWHGMIERRDALAAWGITLDDVDPGVGSIVAVDDLLDAAVAAWSAQRILAGTARAVPDPPEIDPSGRPLVIWA